ncbi:peptidylprolyl isomerase [Micromonospora sp. 067-2]|uniref:peptidylprolyl isomerase n=1 Tax=Micromonospora sp. 067-2 TaxID=2789270 RepID=UPI00397D74B6
MTSTRERQRAAARARLEKEMAERAAKARKRRQTQAIIGAGAALVLVVAGTVWLAMSLGGDDDKTDSAAPAAGAAECVYNQLPADQRSPQIKDVGLPSNQQSGKGVQTMTIDTNLGPITAKVDRSLVPCTAGSFTLLAEKNFFDNTKCHRLVTEGIKVLQCGDPSATGAGWRQTDGTGGPSYKLPEENLPTDKRPPYPEGVIAMANAGPNSTGSQFFIVYGDSPLDAAYTVLGTVTSGLDIVKDVAKAGDDGAFKAQAGGGHPKKEVVIKDLTMSAPQG